MMDFSWKVKNFVKTGKLNTYEQVKALILKEEDTDHLEHTLKGVEKKFKEQLLATHWDKIPEKKRRILIEDLFFENWQNLIENFGELPEHEQVKRLEYLGYLPIAQVADFLLEQMKSKKEGVRLTASAALKKHDPQYLLKPLLYALTKPREWLPSRVFDVLKSLGPQLNTKLYDMVDKVDSEVQEIIVQMLGQIGDGTCLPVLEKLLETEENRVKKRIAEALKELNLPESWPLLIKLLAEEQWQIRMLAIQSLGNLGLEDTIPILIHHKKLEKDDFLRDCIDDAIQEIEDANLPVAVNWVRES